METNAKKNKSIFMIDMYGMPLWLFVVFLGIYYIMVLMDIVPASIIGGLFSTTLLGMVCFKIGDNIPFLNKYLGGGTFVAIFGLAFLKWIGFFPESQIEIIKTFSLKWQFLHIIACCLIAGSLLGMNRKLLMNAGLRYFVPLIGGLAVTFLVVGGVGALLGYGFSEAILFIAAPIMGGGMAAGAVPLSETYAAAVGMDPAELLSIMTPMLNIGNILAIVAAGVLNGLGKKYKNLSGDGQLMQTGAVNIDAEDLKPRKVVFKPYYVITGLVATLGFYGFGLIMMHFVPSIHAYAWMILILAVVKIADIIPREVEDACAFVTGQASREWLIPLLASVGIAIVDFQVVIDVLSNPVVFILCIVCIVTAVLACGFIGKLVKFNFIESAISAGLCMANTGGSGDVATLSAADRMELLPFSTLSSRLGGALIVIIMGAIAPILANLM